jgi:hypothetical protein
VDEPASLDDLFQRFESLPSQDADGVKAGLVNDILAAVAERLAAAEADEERYRTVRDAAARVRLLSPGADGFDEAVLELIDAARERFDEQALAETRAVPPRPGDGGGEPEGEVVTRASEESFPASDPPGYAAGGEAGR